MIEFGKTKYELKYNLKRIEMIENVTNMPVLADIQKNNGFLSILALKTYFAYGLKEEGSDTFVKPKIGMEIAEKAILENGYANTNAEVLEAIQRDCPFFFQEA